jgi:DNA repair protein RecN (Recombination protein N)
MTDTLDREAPEETGRPGGLVELAVRDLALIDELRVELDPGLNVITGETGAGKSLVIDALGLAVGARADTSLVRHGAESARVEALFDRLPEPLIAVREIAASGRSTARLDDEPVTAARLADVGGGLVEIHGQHEQQRLLDGRWQRDLLDAFGGHEAERARVEEAVAAWRSNRAALTELAIDPREAARRLEVLEHEAAEIAAARLRPGEAAEITARLGAARHGEAIARGATAAREALAAEGTGARDTVALAAQETRAIARLDGRFEPLADRLDGLVAEVADAASEIRDLVESVDHDPAELERLSERLALIHGLERRYGEDEAAILAHGERAQVEAERLRGMEGERARRAEADARLLADVAGACEALTVRRRVTGVRLGVAVEAVLVGLGFPPGVFRVEVARRPADDDEPAIELDGDAVVFDAAGADEIVFRLAPNPGEPARPLARIASGGELSRVALAIKQVLAGADQTPVLVFDEIDTGIGGRSADPVGRSLWSLARRHQVLCVTHLPQIAAHADAHFRIAKRARDGRTVTQVVRLDREGRIVELGHMLGGGVGEAGVNPAALAQARELLDRADSWRARELGVG